MKPESIKLVASMHDLAEKSLPPELFEQWDEIKAYYDFREKTDTDAETHGGQSLLNQLKEAEAEITLAQEKLTRARETLKWSKTLFDEKYISQTELQADELAEKEKALNLELARNNRDHLGPGVP